MDSGNFSSLREAKFGVGLSKDGELSTSEGSNCSFNPLDGQQLKSDCLVLSAVRPSLTVCGLRNLVSVSPGYLSSSACVIVFTGLHIAQHCSVREEFSPVSGTRQTVVVACPSLVWQ